MAITETGRICPNCATQVPPARSLCPKCKLQVSKMDEFEAAMRAAQSKGFKGTRVEDNRAPFYRRPGPIVLAVLLVLVASLIVYQRTRPKPPPAWTTFPTEKEEAVRQHLELIATGSDDADLKAYKRLDPVMYDRSREDEKGDYLQLYHVMYQYLTGEFGDNWIATTKLQADPANPEVVLARVGLETLHVRVGLVTPKDALARGEPERYAVRSFDEFPIDEAKGFQTNAARMAVIGAIGGQAAVENIQTILGATRQRRHETPMQIKWRMLPVLRNPRETTYRAIMQTYPVREDPVMKARLEAIRDDQRYDAQTREGADQVLKDKVPEGVLEGAGVVD